MATLVGILVDLVRNALFQNFLLAVLEGTYEQMCTHIFVLVDTGMCPLCVGTATGKVWILRHAPGQYLSKTSGLPIFDNFR